MKVALISAVHSNLPALEAVLDDITGVGVDARWPSSSAPVPWSSLAAAPLAESNVDAVLAARATYDTERPVV